MSRPAPKGHRNVLVPDPPCLLALLGLCFRRSRLRPERVQGDTQIPSLDSLLGDNGGAVSVRIIQMVMVLTVLSIAPGLLIMVTSFTAS